MGDLVRVHERKKKDCRKEALASLQAMEELGFFQRDDEEGLLSFENISGVVLKFVGWDRVKSYLAEGYGIVVERRLS